MATPTLQHRTSYGLWLGVLSVGLLSAGLGYLLGKTHPKTPDPLMQALQEPMTIVEASAFSGFAAEQVPDIDAKQLSGTVGKLHADILTLRMLYRRLAEDAGLDLTDFMLDDVLASPTTSSNEGGKILEKSLEDSSDEPLSEPLDEPLDELGALQNQLEQINASSLALKNWYQLRVQQRSFELAGPVVTQGQMSSRFGWRVSPYTGQTRMHRGVDYSGRRGEPILALADGIVSFSGAVHAYGNMVELSHADGLTTRYAHNESNTVTVGQRVEQGQIIARLGSTGRSTGPHVHLEVHLNGEPVDPMLFIQ